MALPNLEDFLKLNAVNKGQPFTHTRIGDKESKISGGLYNIIDNKKFLDKYYIHVFENHNKEYLTEKQFVENAPLLIDISVENTSLFTYAEIFKNTT